MILAGRNLTNAFAGIEEFWAPRVGGDIGNMQLKLAKFKGEFHWHRHDNEDELFLVVRGRLLMKLRAEQGGDVVVMNVRVPQRARQQGKCGQGAKAMCRAGVGI